MNDSNDRARIVRATLWALIAGVLIAVCVVLPAEFGVDPTGFGRLTGLSAMSTVEQAAEAAPATTAAAPADAAAAGGATANGVATAAGTAAPLAVWANAHPDKFQSKSFDITLKGDEELEYKATVKRGEPLLYTWRVKEGSQVYYEFHGEPTEGTWAKDYYESYEKGEKASGQGSMIAPFTGHHGWYFLNLSEKPVTVTVELAGYYDQFERVGG